MYHRKDVCFQLIAVDMTLSRRLVVCSLCVVHVYITKYLVKSESIVKLCLADRASVNDTLLSVESFAGRTHSVPYVFIFSFMLFSLVYFVYFLFV